MYKAKNMNGRRNIFTPLKFPYQTLPMTDATDRHREMYTRPSKPSRKRGVANFDRGELSGTPWVILRLETDVLGTASHSTGPAGRVLEIVGPSVLIVPLQRLQLAVVFIAGHFL